MSGVVPYAVMVVASALAVHLAAAILFGTFGVPLTGGALTAFVYPFGEELGKLLGVLLIWDWAAGRQQVPLVVRFGTSGAAIIGVAIVSLGESALYLACGFVHLVPGPIQQALCSLPSAPLGDLVLRRMIAAPGHLVHSLFFIIPLSEARRRPGARRTVLIGLGFLVAVASHASFNAAGLLGGPAAVLRWWRFGVLVLMSATIYFLLRRQPAAPHSDDAQDSEPMA